MAAARKFNPIFNAVVTPATVRNVNGPNGRYAVLKDATVAYGRKSEVRTLLAFGEERNAIASLLRKGKPVKLAVQFNGGTLRIKGEPLIKDPKVDPRQLDLLDACVQASGFAEHASYGY